MPESHDARSCLAVLALCFLTLPLGAAAGEAPVVELDGVKFKSWPEYVASDYFKIAGGRCGTPSREIREALWGHFERGSDPADCSAFSTNPTTDYDPTVLYEIQVWCTSSSTPTAAARSPTPWSPARSRS